MNIRTSNETPTILGLEVEPDWSAQVFEIEEFLVTALKKTEAGKEQRLAWRPKPQRIMRYTVASTRIAEHADYITTVLGHSRGPLLVPWWPDGLRLAIDMPDADNLQLEIPPGVCHDIAAGGSMLVGGVPREVASIATKFVVLVSDPAGEAATQGAWVYPMRLAIMVDAGGALNRLRYDESAQAIQFMEL